MKCLVAEGKSTESWQLFFLPFMRFWGPIKLSSLWLLSFFGTRDLCWPHTGLHCMFLSQSQAIKPWGANITAEMSHTCFGDLFTNTELGYDYVEGIFSCFQDILCINHSNAAIQLWVFQHTAEASEFTGSMAMNSRYQSTFGMQAQNYWALRWSSGDNICCGLLRVNLSLCMFFPDLSFLPIVV